MVIRYLFVQKVVNCCLLRNRFPDLWVAPDILERTTIYTGNARIYAYLCYKNKLLIVTQEDNGQPFYSRKFLSIYRGTMKGKNKNNNHGIIIVIDGKNYVYEKIIFPYQQGYSDGAHADILLGGISDGN